MVNLLLSVTFACGVLIAVAHVVNHRFIAPVYDVILNLVAFCSSAAASALLHHVVPAVLSGLAVVCWLVLARRTALHLRARRSEPDGIPVPWNAATPPTEVEGVV